MSNSYSQRAKRLVALCDNEPSPTTSEVSTISSCSTMSPLPAWWDGIFEASDVVAVNNRPTPILLDLAKRKLTFSPLKESIDSSARESRRPISHEVPSDLSVVEPLPEDKINYREAGLRKASAFQVISCYANNTKLSPHQKEVDSSLNCSVAAEILPTPSDTCESASGMLMKVGSIPGSIQLEVPNHSAVADLLPEDKFNYCGAGLNSKAAVEVISSHGNISKINPQQKEVDSSLNYSVAAEILPTPSDTCESASGMLIKVGSVPGSIQLEIPNHSAVADLLPEDKFNYCGAGLNSKAAVEVISSHGNISKINPQQKEVDSSLNYSVAADVLFIESCGSASGLQCIYPSQMKIRAAKLALNSGKEHITTSGKLKKARSLKEPCKKSCKRCAVPKLTLNDRQEINSVFWALKDHVKQWAYIHNSVTSTATKRKSSASGAFREKLSSRKYHFTVCGTPKKVCKTMFKNTLNICDSWIDSALSHSTNGQTNCDKRGKISLSL